MDSFPYTQNRTVSQVVSVDPMVQSQLEFFRTAHVERHEYASSRNGHIQYLTQWVRPFAALIQCCIPLGALSSAEMPEGRVEFLQPYVVSYIEKAVRPSLLWLPATVRHDTDARARAGVIIFHRIGPRAQRLRSSVH